MKKLFMTFAAMLLTAFVFAQSPNKMSYQAVIRNNSNALITNQAVGMRISIIQGNSSGTAVYVETHTPTTNANGLASIEIGGGLVVSGTFSTINWANGPYFVKTETDPAGGTSYSIAGTSQLLSVPYALHAKNTDSWSVNADTIYTFKKVGVGTSSPNLSLDIRTDNISAIRGAGFSQYSSNNFASLLHLNKFRGSLTNPISVINNDYIGGLVLSGYNGTSNSVNSPSIGSIVIGSKVNGNVTSSSVPQDLFFATGATTTQSDSYAQNTVRMVISSSGNVGIGTTTPVSKLDILGEISSRSTSSPANVFTIYDNNNLQRFSNDLNYTSTLTQYDFDVLSPTNGTDVNVRFFRSTNTTGSKYISFMRGNGTTSISASIAVDGGNSYFQNHGGNFGIGTSSPARTLHVNAVMRLEPIATAPTTPAKGDMYFDSTLNKLRVYDGATWQNCW